MASLVADYGTDSESNGSDEDASANHSVQCSTQKVSSHQPSQNYLIAGEDDSSSDSEDSNNAPPANETKKKLPNPLLEEKLPTPSLGNVVTDQTEGSVFTNRYDTAEHAKKSILEKHVKMTEAQFLTGKKAKTCRKFKQGRCFYGNNCQYSHDIDSNLSLRYKKDEPIPSSGEDSTPVPNKVPLRRHRNPHAPQLPDPPRQQQGFMGTLNTLKRNPGPSYTPKQQHQFRQQARFMDGHNEADEDDDKFNVGDKRKKRVGVSQTLVPPKRAMNALSRQREEERPWTMQK